MEKIFPMKKIFQYRGKSAYAGLRTGGLGDRLFDLGVGILIVFAVIICVYPFLYVLSVSVSDPVAVQRGEVVLLPRGFDTTIFAVVLHYRDLWTSYANTAFYVVAGASLNVLFTCLAAFPLSRRQFCLRKRLNFMLAFTMYFSGGLIPTYMLVTGLGLYNARLAMILPVLVSAYNVMICRSAFESLGEELFESAKLEGANDFVMLSRIAVPLIKPTLAVITLYYAVARYNDFFNGLLYISDKAKQPLQMFLRRILLQASTEILQGGMSDSALTAAAQSTLQIRYVCVVLAAVPILCLCPFVQKYLVKGTMLGAVKG